MSKIMQNLFVFMEPSVEAYETPLKGGNLILNRFFIDEEAAFELSGVKSLRKTSLEDKEVEIKLKGKEYSFLRSYFILRNSTLRNLTLISMNN